MWRMASVSLGLLLCFAGTFLVGQKRALHRQETRTVLTVTAPQETTGTAVPMGELLLEVEGTDLVAQRLVAYEGPYIEDGSDTPVVNIAALVLYNAGQEEILEAEVTLELVDTTWVFYGTNIPPGMSVMVLEQSMQPYTKESVTACHGMTSTGKAGSTQPEQITLEVVDMGTLAITNTTNTSPENICLFHKNYLPDGTYVGGITYKTCIDSIAPGQTLLIQPEHYADGYSKVFKVQIQ